MTLKMPIFDDYNFNREGKKVRAEFMREVSNGKDTYKIWQTLAKNSHPRNELDVYNLYVEVGDYIVPLGMTEWKLREQVGWAAAKEELYGNDDGKRTEAWNANKDTSVIIKKEDVLVEKYGQDYAYQANYIKHNVLDKHIKSYVDARDNGGRFADYIGAATLGEIGKCEELSKKIRAIREQEEEQYRAKVKAERAKEKAEWEAKRQKAMEEASTALKCGGIIDNGEILVALAKAHGVTIPLRTMGWMYSAFASCKVTVKDGLPEYSVRYYKKGSGNGSAKIYDVIDSIREAVCTA